MNEMSNEAKIKAMISLTDEELYALSIEKDKNKVSTKRALIAQYILWKRAGNSFHSEDHYVRDYTVIRKF